MMATNLLLLVRRLVLLILVVSHLMLVASCLKGPPPLDLTTIAGQIPSDIRSILEQVIQQSSSSSSSPRQQPRRRQPAMSTLADVEEGLADSNKTTGEASTDTTSSIESSAAALLDYSIFRGHSAIRDLHEEQQGWIERYSKPVATLLLLILHNTSESSALLSPSLILDAAHEVVLGVRPENVDEAEYAATHPGETTWMQDHPLSDIDDWLHSIIHRREGDARGEGNHSGWENAKYWAAGGPKQLYGSRRGDTAKATPTTTCSTTKVVAAELARIARQYAPLCVQAGVVTTTSPMKHSILADGQERRRIVSLPNDCWDPFCFINLLARYSLSSSSSSSSSSSQSEQDMSADDEQQLQQQQHAVLLRQELSMLLQAELALLLKHATTNTAVIDANKQ